MHGDKRRRRLERSGIGAILASLLIIAGCATPPVDRESMEYTRIDAQNRAADRYELMKRKCRAAGGVMLVQGDWSKIKSKSRDIKLARCGTRVDYAIW